MKKMLLAAAAAATALSGAAAQAQTWRGHDDHRGDNRSYSRDWSHNDNRGGWNRDHDGWRGENRAYSGRWRTGQVYPYYARRDRMISDWGRYHLPPPRAGYGYYYDDNGDVVMAALASGLIGMVLGNAISDQGYSQPYAQPYGYSQPYGYGYQPYGYRY